MIKNLSIAIIFTLTIAASVLAQGDGAIKGTVADENGAKIAGAQVVLTSGAGVQVNTSTDRSGTFEFKNPRSGSYFVEVKANGNMVTKQISGRAKIDPLVATFCAAILMSWNPEAVGARKFQMIFI